MSGPASLAPRAAAGKAGLIAAALILALFGGAALSIDVPETTFGFHSDEATYYLIGHSLAQDGDLEYRREDLLRTFAEYPSGPSGVFLKKGQTVDGQPDPDQERLYFGKSFVYPLFAAPLVKVFGTNGFLFFNALLMAAAFLAAYTFLNARSSPAAAMVFALAFVLATVAPAYAFWIAPEVFNWSLGTLAYFCWLYKEVAPEGRSRWLRGARSDYAAAALAGILTFSKVTNGAMFLPVALWLLWKRQWARALTATAVFAIVTAALFGANVASSGDWNYQGGAINGEVTRYTFHARPNGQPGFPFQTPDFQYSAVAQEVARNESLWDVIFDPNVFFTNFTWNSFYTFFGRHAGIVPYFFPAALGMAMFLWRARARPGWQWLVLLSCAMQIGGVMVAQPYTWNGSGGSLGNRYFMSAYGMFVFLLPPLASAAAGIVAWTIGTLFTAKILLHPFYYSYNPDEPSWSGPLRVLPVERTLVNDLPMNTDIRRVRVLFGQDPRFQLYYVDDNAFFREPDDWFWVRGNARADLILKVAEPVRTLQLRLTGGPMPVKGVVRLGWRSERYDLQPGQEMLISFETGDGFPYLGTRVWNLSITADGGFIPQQFEPANPDSRFLGVRVKPVLVR